IHYDDDAQENVADAIVMQHAAKPERVYVLLITGPTKALAKRAAELGRIVTSLEVDDAKPIELDAAKAQPLDEARRAAFFAFVEEARGITGVPGAAVAVVTKDGAFTKGFGVRAEGAAAAVDTGTQFMIGSITKSFSTLLIAGHVSEPKAKDFAKAYARELRTRVLDRLGMKDSTLDQADVKKRGNHAVPHHFDWTGASEKLDMSIERNLDWVAPAGGLWS